LLLRGGSFIKANKRSFSSPVITGILSQAAARLAYKEAGEIQFQRQPVSAWINQHPLLFVSALILCLIAFWIFVVNIISLASGWRLLAKRFRAQQPFRGQIWKWQGAAIRGAGYNGCLIVGADPMGLSLDIMAMFRPGHDPLFIPWTEIALRHEPWLPREPVEIKLGSTEQIRFRIRGTLASQLQQAAGMSWIIDENYPPEGPGRSGPGSNERSYSTRFIRS